VVRAVEVLELTGRRPSELRTSWERGGGPYETVVAGLSWDREELERRAIERVRYQLEAGLVGELRRLGPSTLSRTALQALGVKEMIPVIEGATDIENARIRLVRNTKSFIRRQLSWFKADPRVEWVNASAVGWDAGCETIVKLFLDAL
jgi:tRNA dimethylallyltransferase